jgi:hypothetical protein
MASNGRMLISILSAAQDFVSLPLPPAASGASGPLTKITSDATIKGGLSITGTGPKPRRRRLAQGCSLRHPATGSMCPSGP